MLIIKRNVWKDAGMLLIKLAGLGLNSLVQNQIW